jgi:DNA-binding PucR family transcriptional regulator
LRETVRRATARTGADCLVTTRASGVVVVVAHELKWAELARVLRSECGSKVRVGVGGRYRLVDLSKSLADAEFALKITASAGLPVAIFDELGVWRLLARPDAGDLEELVDHWIGALIAYDRQHRSELLKTLFSYLNEFGVLEATSGKLFVHRNTLKYRLVRISELTGWDLNDPEHRFHLDLACRAWMARQALEGSSTSPRDSGGRGAQKATRVSALPTEGTARPLSARRARPTSRLA